MNASRTSPDRGVALWAALQATGWALAFIMGIWISTARWAIGETAGPLQGPENDIRVSGAPTPTDTLEVSGQLRNDCITIPECCFRPFCLLRCGQYGGFFLESDSVDLGPLLGQEVRLLGSFFNCGAIGCHRIFQVVGAVAAPCSTMAIEPTTWGRIKAVYP